MAQVEVRDTSIWVKHVRGDPALTAQLEGLTAGATIRLRVAGRTGLWEKMRNTPSGTAMQGLKPVQRQLWEDVYPAKKGELVDIDLARDDVPETWEKASDAERDAAWTAFKALTKAGWSSASSGELSRDDLHER